VFLLQILSLKPISSLSSFVNLLILSSYFLIVFIIGEIAYRKLGVSAEITRKWSHIASGFLALLFPFYFDHFAWVILICATFGVFLFICKHYKFLPSINAVERRTHGSILFPLAVTVSFISYQYNHEIIYYYLPVLTLAICDLCAAIVGKRFPIKSIKIYLETKSLGGYLAFVISFVLLNITFVLLGYQIPVYFILFTAFFTAFIELLSPRGFDNISIPLSVILCMMILM
jgi:phosphatidate cytidylyltransferase/phytol kinase